MTKYIGPISNGKDLVNKDYVDGSVATLLDIIIEDEEITAAALNALNASINALDASITLVGVPSGGAEGQILSKASDADYDMEWINNTTDTKVTQTATDTSRDYDILFTAGISHTTSTATTRFASESGKIFRYNPYTGLMVTYDVSAHDVSANGNIKGLLYPNATLSNAYILTYANNPIASNTTEDTKPVTAKNVAQYVASQSATIEWGTWS